MITNTKNYFGCKNDHSQNKILRFSSESDTFIFRIVQQSRLCRSQHSGCKIKFRLEIYLHSLSCDISLLGMKLGFLVNWWTQKAIFGEIKN